MEFYTQKCAAFTDEEENQHCHMDIFEAYVKLVDKAIDVHLQERFSKEQIQNFYDDFKNNYEHYKEVNYDTVDVLNNSIDFN